MGRPLKRSAPTSASLIASTTLRHPFPAPHRLIEHPPDQDGSSRSVIVLRLVEDGQNVCLDGGEVMLRAHSSAEGRLRGGRGRDRRRKSREKGEVYGETGKGGVAVDAMRAMVKGCDVFTRRRPKQQFRPSARSSREPATSHRVSFLVAWLGMFKEHVLEAGAEAQEGSCFTARKATSNSRGGSHQNPQTSDLSQPPPHGALALALYSPVPETESTVFSSCPFEYLRSDLSPTRSTLPPGGHSGGTHL